MKLDFYEGLAKIVMVVISLASLTMLLCLTVFIMQTTYEGLTKTPESCASARGVEGTDK
jgi:hypothetical protein